MLNFERHGGSKESLGLGILNGLKDLRTLGIVFREIEGSGFFAKKEEDPILNLSGAFITFHEEDPKLIFDRVVNHIVGSLKNHNRKDYYRHILEDPQFLKSLKPFIKENKNGDSNPGELLIKFEPYYNLSEYGDFKAIGRGFSRDFSQSLSDHIIKEIRSRLYKIKNV